MTGDGMLAIILAYAGRKAYSARLNGDTTTSQPNLQVPARDQRNMNGVR